MGMTVLGRLAVVERARNQDSIEAHLIWSSPMKMSVGDRWFATFDWLEHYRNDARNAHDGFARIFGLSSSLLDSQLNDRKYSSVLED